MAQTRARVKKATNTSQPPPTPVVDKAPKKGRPRKPTSRAKSSVEPEAINQKLKAIADLEDKAATVYTDDTTPGGPSEQAQTKKVSRSTTQLRKITVATTDISDLSDLEDGPETDNEGTVQRKGKGKGAQNYREAIQAIQKKPLELVPVAEDEEMSMTGPRAAKHVDKIRDEDRHGSGGEGGRCDEKNVGMVNIQDLDMEDSNGAKGAEMVREKGQVKEGAQTGTTMVEREGGGEHEGTETRHESAKARRQIPSANIGDVHMRGIPLVLIFLFM